jgi:hypothetical protein
MFTVTKGTASHVEGYHTKAAAEYSHVQGKYNIEDTKNKYAHIVGNGTAETSRSNAHTLDWDGNAYYAGNVYVKSGVAENAVRLPVTYSGTAAPSDSLGIDGDIYIMY